MFRNGSFEITINLAGTGFETGATKRSTRYVLRAISSYVQRLIVVAEILWPPVKRRAGRKSRTDAARTPVTSRPIWANLYASCNVSIRRVHCQTSILREITEVMSTRVRVYSVYMYVYICPILTVEINLSMNDGAIVRYIYEWYCMDEHMNGVH